MPLVYGRALAKKYGHDVRIINPKKVKGFLQGQKTDANDAFAICIAAMQIGGLSQISVIVYAVTILIY